MSGVIQWFNKWHLDVYWPVARSLKSQDGKYRIQEHVLAKPWMKHEFRALFWGGGDKRTFNRWEVLSTHRTLSAAKRALERFAKEIPKGYRALTLADDAGALHASGQLMDLCTCGHLGSRHNAGGQAKCRSARCACMKFTWRQYVTPK